MTRALLKGLLSPFIICFLLTVLPIAANGQRQQCTRAFTIEGILSSLRKRVLRKDDLQFTVKQVQRCGVTSELTPADEDTIRRLGKYLGKEGIDDLVAAIRKNYRADTPSIAPKSSPSNDLPLSFLNEIPFKGGSPQKLDNLMTAAGYAGTTVMAVLIVASNETNQSEVIVGTRPDLNAKNSARLQGGGDSFNFPGGESTSRVYILSSKDGKIDVAYRPQSMFSTTPAAPNVQIGTLQCLVYDDDKADDFHIGDGLRGATCVARNRQTKEEYMGTTNFNGLATISVPYGFYIVTIKAPQYSTEVTAAQLVEFFVTVEVRLKKIR